MAPPADLTLVTGATGFVGSAVARALLARGERVRVLARPNGNRRNLAGLPVEITEGAMEDPRSLARAVAGCRYVYHVAADYRIWVPDPAPMFRANVEGTRDLLTAALDAGVERIVYTSSVATLGLISGGSADEATPSSISEMIGPYKQSKFAAEELVRDLFYQRGLPVVIVNPSTPVGPHDVKPTPTGRLIVEAACGRMPAFVDTGLNIVHVDDVAEGHLAAADKGRIGERYILGGENMALAEILAEVASTVGRRPPRLRMPHRMLFPVAFGAELAARVTGREPFVTLDGVRMSRKKMYFSSERASRELAYAPRPARQAIADAVAWFAANGYLK
ncbi:MAG: NAD-dependent epimerase/dehydratase family protein [Alphaproteobacteria bacterium]|nr:NAD-dependent epimerase/dehydratase family protein [Alphaproteobacteria bacterium]